MTCDLRDRVAVVTGASRGIGEATARALSEAGASVVVNYFEEGLGVNRQDADKVVNAIVAQGGRAIAVAADVSNATEVSTMARRAIEHFGGVHILVNNAAIVCDKTLRKLTLEDWDAVIATNLTGVYLCCRAFLDTLESSGNGAIVNVSSVSAQIGLFGQSNYAASKGGVVSLTRVLSRELARKNIRVNAVAPGLVDTDMVRTIPEEVLAKMVKEIPMGRVARPEEIANVIVFLSSDEASFITGQVIGVNGGWY